MLSLLALLALLLPGQPGCRSPIPTFCWFRTV